MKPIDLEDIYNLSGLNCVGGASADFTLTDLQKHFRSNDILPPRTGHLGDWNAFLSHSGTALDFNPAIVSMELGYPLIVGTTRTEHDESHAGDRVYCPASTFENKKRKRLFTCKWTQNRWQPSNESTYCPFTAVDLGGNLISLTQFHVSTKPAVAQLEAKFLLKHESFIIDFVLALNNYANRQDVPKRVLSNIFSHWLMPDGTLSDIDDFQFSREQISRAFVPFQAQCDAGFLFSDYTLMKEPIPVFSGLFVFFLEAILNADRKNPFSSHVHFHWGARSMAGIPPENGYLFSQGTQRRLKRLFDATRAVLPSFRNLTIVLLPAPIFLLFQPSHSENNQALFWSRFRQRSFYDSASPGEPLWNQTDELMFEKIFSLNERTGQYFRTAGGMTE